MEGNAIVTIPANIPQGQPLVDTVDHSHVRLSSVSRSCPTSFGRRRSRSRRWKRELPNETGEDLSMTSVLSEFCENSSIHALRQLSEPHQYTFRRIVWVSVLVVGIGIFISQLIESVNRYYSREVTVNLKVNYNDTLTFPAVTICNQNAVRATVAHELGIYGQLSDLYTRGPHINTNSLSARGLPKRLTMSQLFARAAHRKEDLILGCAFGDEKCGLEDFATTPTDYGTCYTFNNGRQGGMAREVRAPGIQHGLKLELNIEQYEYMPGPNVGAGLRVLLHSQHETPAVRDFGIAVPLGSQAFIGVEIIQANYLRPPYGQCEDDRKLQYFNNYNQANCIFDCRERFVYHRCHCRESLNVKAKGAERFPQVCTMKQYVTCVVPALHLFERVSVRCRCPIPCTRIIHNPVVTYGGNIHPQQMHSLPGLTEFMKTNTERVAMAKDITLRHNQGFRSLYERGMSALDEAVQSIGNLTDTLGQSLITTEEKLDMLLLSLIGFLQLHQNMSSTVDEILKLKVLREWEILHGQVLGRLSMRQEDVVENLSSFTETKRRISKPTHRWMKDFLGFFLDEQVSTQLKLLKQSRKRLKQFISFLYLRDQNDNQTFHCKDILFQKILIQSKFAGKLKTKLKGVVQAMVFMQDCLNKLQDTKKLFISTGRKSRRQMERAISNCTKINRQYDEIRQQLCSLMKDLESKSKMEVTIAASLRTELSHKYENMKSELNEFKLFQTEMTNDITVIKEFLYSSGDLLTNKSLTTTQIYEITMSDSITSALQRIDQNIHYINYKIGNFKNQAVVFNSAIQGTIENLWNSSFLKVPSAESELFDEDSALNCLSPSWSGYSPREKHAIHVIRNISLEDLRAITKVQNDQLTKLLNSFQNEDYHLQSAFNAFRDHLSDSVGSQLNGYNFVRENYLSLDIFMRELSYEEITQQVAYDENNLWGDIGGSVGLFVGASLITVFEVIDAFVFNAFRLINGKTGLAVTKKADTGTSTTSEANGTHGKMGPDENITLKAAQILYNPQP